MPSFPDQYAGVAAPPRPRRRPFSARPSAPIPLAPRRKPLGGIGRNRHVHYDPTTGRKREDTP